MHSEIRQKRSNLQVAPAPLHGFGRFLHQSTELSLNTPHKSGKMQDSVGSIALQCHLLRGYNNTDTININNNSRHYISGDDKNNDK